MLSILEIKEYNVQNVMSNNEKRKKFIFLSLRAQIHSKLMIQHFMFITELYNFLIVT